jgi:hypothetical protein
MSAFGSASMLVGTGAEAGPSWRCAMTESTVELARGAVPLPRNGHQPPSLLPPHVPVIAGRSVPADDDLLERTLAFSGSYVSDDGHVTIRRSGGRAAEYSGERFIGFCMTCWQARLTRSDGERLPDIRSAAAFVAAHDHAQAD